MKKKKQYSSHWEKIRNFLEFLTHTYDFALPYWITYGQKGQGQIKYLWCQDLHTGFNPVLSGHVLENRIEDFKAQILCPRSKFLPQTLNNFSLKPKETNPKPKNAQNQIFSGKTGEWEEGVVEAGEGECDAFNIFWDNL